MMSSTGAFFAPFAILPSAFLVPRLVVRRAKRLAVWYRLYFLFFRTLSASLASLPIAFFRPVLVSLSAIRRAVWYRLYFRTISASLTFLPTALYRPGLGFRSAPGVAIWYRLYFRTLSASTTFLPLCAFFRPVFGFGIAPRCASVGFFALCAPRAIITRPCTFFLPIHLLIVCANWLAVTVLLLFVVRFCRG